MSDSPSRAKSRYWFWVVVLLLSGYLSFVDGHIQPVVFLFWVLVLWLLALPFRTLGWISFRLRSRRCPVCGVRLLNGVTFCESCGSDLRLR